MIAVYIIIGLVVLFLFFMILMYNGLVKARNQVKNAWSQIDVQLKRRHDLIPNLVETVKGYAKHERATFEAVTNARNMAQAAIGTGVAAQAKAEGELSGFLSRLLAVAEAYPELKANQNFLALQEELSSTENRIGFSRQFYNDSVLGYNNKIQMFPTNIMSSMFGFHPSQYFQPETPAEREVPKVSFS